MMGDVIEFRDDDAAYLGWLADHPAGFVLNSRAQFDPGYLILHRATCGTISRDQPPGAYTGRGYVKIAATDHQALMRWAKMRASGFSSVCGLCKPGSRA